MFRFRNKIRSKTSAVLHSVPVADAAAAVAPPPPPPNTTTVGSPKANTISRTNSRRRHLETNTNTDHHVTGSSPVSTNRKKEASAKLCSPPVTNKKLDNTNKPCARTAKTTTRSTAEQAVLDFDESFRLLSVSSPSMKAPTQTSTGETKIPIFDDFQQTNTRLDFMTAASSDSEYEEEIIDDETYQSYLLQSQREIDYQHRTATTSTRAEQAVLDFDESFKLMNVSSLPMTSPIQNSAGETKLPIFASFQKTDNPLDFKSVSSDSDYEEEIIDEETYQAYLLQSQREIDYQQSTQLDVDNAAYDEITIGSDEFNEYMSVVGQETVNPIQPQMDRLPPSVINLEGLDRVKPLSVIGQGSVNNIEAQMVAQKSKTDAVLPTDVQPTNDKKTISSENQKKSKSSKRHKEDNKIERSGAEKKKKKSPKKKSKHRDTTNDDNSKKIRSTSKKKRHHKSPESLSETASDDPTRGNDSSRKMPSSPAPLSPTRRTLSAASGEAERISAHFRRGEFTSQTKELSSRTFSLTSDASSVSKLTLPSREGSSVKERKSRKSKESVDGHDVKEKMQLKRFLSSPNSTGKGLSEKGSKSVKSKESSDRDNAARYKKTLVEQGVDSDGFPIASKEGSISTEAKEKKKRSMLKTPTNAAPANRDFHDGTASVFSLTRSPLPKKTKIGTPTVTSKRLKASSTVMVPKVSLKTHPIGATRMEVKGLSSGSGSEAPEPNGSPKKRGSQKIMYIPSPKVLPKTIQL